MTGRLYALALACLLALSCEHAVAETVSFAWDASPDAQSVPGITYELQANGVSASGITGTSHDLQIPSISGNMLNARVRAVLPPDLPIACCPPPGCGDPPAPPTVPCWTSGDWIYLTGIFPAIQTNLHVTKTLQDGGGNQMALTKVGSGSFVEYDNESSKSLTKDTGTASGDLGIILFSYYSNGWELNTPSGWTKQNDVSITGDTRAAVLTRVMDGTEGATFTVTTTGGVYANAILLTLRGSTALAVASSTAGTPASGTTVTAPSVTAGSNQGIVAAMAYSDPSTITTPSGMTLGIEGGQNTDTGTLFFETLAGAGATGDRVSTLGTSRDNIGFTILIDGASGGGGTPITVDGSVGNSVASGSTATINQAVNLGTSTGGATAAGISAAINQKFSVACSPGNASAAGTSAVVNQGQSIPCTVANASSNGTTADISLGGQISINCSTGSAIAQGQNGTINQAFSIPCQTGNSSAAGIHSVINQSSSVSCSQGASVANGVASVINQAVKIDCAVGNSVASGQTALIGPAINIACTTGNAVSNGVAAGIRQDFRLDSFAGNAIATGINSGISLVSIEDQQAHIGGDDVPSRNPNTGWDRKAWAKKKKQEDAIESTIRDTYRKLIGETPTKEAVKSVAKEIKQTQPDIASPEIISYAYLVEWIDRQKEVIRNIISARIQEQDDEETLLMLI